MAHARKQIRDAIVAKLTGLTTTGSKVYASRVWPMGSDKLPGLIVYTVKESAEITTMGAVRNSYRQLEVAIDIYAKGSGVDDTVDQIAQEIKTALNTDQTLGGLTKDLMLESINIKLNGTGDKNTVVSNLIYVAEYQVNENDAEVLT